MLPGYRTLEVTERNRNTKRSFPKIRSVLGAREGPAMDKVALIAAELT